VRLVDMQNRVAEAEIGIVQQWLPSRGRWQVKLEDDRLEVKEHNLEFVEAHQDASRDFPLPVERRSIAVNGIGSETPVKFLQLHFQRFGRVQYIYAEGQSAVIVFAEASSASAAILATDHFPIGRSDVPVDVDWITPAQKFAPQYLPVKPKDNDSGNKRLLGVIKYLNHSKGQGFIACPQIQCISGFDVFITSHHLRQDFFLGQEVSFRIMYHKGKPQAHDICARPLEERFQGTVKSFSPENRYGFIEGTQVMNQLWKEVYFKAKETIISGSSHALETGATVSFRLHLAFQSTKGLVDGTPEAVDVKIESTPSSLSQE